MTPYAAEAYKRITGVDPPKPFDEKTTEERIRDRERFFALVNSGTDADDEAVDELFAVIRAGRNPPERINPAEDELESA